MNHLVDLLRSVLLDPTLLAVAAAFSALMLTGTAARVIDVVERRPVSPLAPHRRDQSDA